MHESSIASTPDALLEVPESLAKSCRPVYFLEAPAGVNQNTGSPSSLGVIAEKHLRQESFIRSSEPLVIRIDSTRAGISLAKMDDTHGPSGFWEGSASTPSAKKRSGHSGGRVGYLLKMSTPPTNASRQALAILGYIPRAPHSFE